MAVDGRDWQGSGDSAGSAGEPASRRSTRGRRFPAEVLSEDEVLRLLAACGATPAGMRNRAMIALLYRSGLRIGEALALRPKDLDLERGAIRVLHGKGGRARTVGIDPGGAAIVQAWMVVRETRGLDGASPVLCLLDGRPMSTSHVRVLLPRIGRRAGIEKRVHAHGFRHTHAAELRRDGIEVGIISKQLGHRSIATTAVYLDHVAPLAVVEAVRGRGWQSDRSFDERGLRQVAAAVDMQLRAPRTR